MAVAQQDTWSKSRTESTLRQLRKDYPGYTTNELYAIWCHVNGEVPLDSEGKVLVEQWVRQGQEDGEHSEDGPFRVSPMLYGRALKAEKGVTKPPRKKRQAKPETQDAAPTVARNGNLSPRALEFAQEYDQAAKVINAIVLHRHEINDLVAELKATRPLILQELAAVSQETRELLVEVGALEVAAGDWPEGLCCRVLQDDLRDRLGK